MSSSGYATPKPYFIDSNDPVFDPNYMGENKNKKGFNFYDPLSNTWLEGMSPYNFFQYMKNQYPQSPEHTQEFDNLLMFQIMLTLYNESSRFQKLIDPIERDQTVISKDNENRWGNFLTAFIKIIPPENRFTPNFLDFAFKNPSTQTASVAVNQAASEATNLKKIFASKEYQDMDAALKGRSADTKLTAQVQLMEEAKRDLISRGETKIDAKMLQDEIRAIQRERKRQSELDSIDHYVTQRSSLPGMPEVPPGSPSSPRAFVVPSLSSSYPTPSLPTYGQALSNVMNKFQNMGLRQIVHDYDTDPEKAAQHMTVLKFRFNNDQDAKTFSETFGGIASGRTVIAGERGLPDILLKSGITSASEVAAFIADLKKDLGPPANPPPLSKRFGV